MACCSTLCMEISALFFLSQILVGDDDSFKTIMSNPLAPKINFFFHHYNTCTSVSQCHCSLYGLMRLYCKNPELHRSLSTVCVCVCVCVVYFAVQSTKTSTWSQKKVSCCCWLLLCSAIFRSQADSLHLHVILHEWLAFYSALKKKNPPMCLWCTYSTDMAGATLTAAVLALCVYTIQPCPMSLQTKPYICIRKVHACLDVTCYLHF